MVKEALPVGSMLIVNCTICNNNFEFEVFVFSHHRESMRAGDWESMVKEAMGFKARWFTIVVCLTALHSIVAQCWLLLLSSSSQSFYHHRHKVCDMCSKSLQASEASWWFIIVPGLVKSPQVKSHLCFREAFKSATSFIQKLSDIFLLFW